MLVMTHLRVGCCGPGTHHQPSACFSLPVAPEVSGAGAGTTLKHGSVQGGIPRKSRRPGLGKTFSGTLLHGGSSPAPVAVVTVESWERTLRADCRGGR
ncbi:unnamed protein product [Arctogadus glacialis]